MLGYKYGGSMAEYCVTNMQSSIEIPDELSLEQGAASFVNPLSALSMVDRLIELKVKAVIVTAASS